MLQHSSIIFLIEFALHKLVSIFSALHDDSNYLDIFKIACYTLYSMTIRD